VPPARELVVTLSGGAVTLILRLADVEPGVGVSESVTVIVKFDVPVNVPLGVPVIAPEPAFRLNPAGRVPEVTAQ